MHDLWTLVGDLWTKVGAVLLGCSSSSSQSPLDTYLRNLTAPSHGTCSRHAAASSSPRPTRSRVATTHSAGEATACQTALPLSAA